MVFRWFSDSKIDFRKEKNMQILKKNHDFLMIFDDFDDFLMIFHHFGVFSLDFRRFHCCRPKKCSISELRWSCGIIRGIYCTQMNHTSRLDTSLGRQRKARSPYEKIWQFIVLNVIYLPSGSWILCVPVLFFIHIIMDFQKSKNVHNVIDFRENESMYKKCIKWWSQIVRPKIVQKFRLRRATMFLYTF